MVGGINGGQTLAIEIFFCQPGVFHCEARGPGEILGGGFARFARLAAEPVRGRLADPGNRCLSSDAHEKFPLLVPRQIVQRHRAVKRSNGGAILTVLSSPAITRPPRLIPADSGQAGNFDF